MTEREKALGLARLRHWPKEHLTEAAALTGREQTLLVEAAAIMDIRPLAPEDVPSPGPGVIEIDLRRRS